MSEHSKSGPLPPYGVPIRDAIARGDMEEMRRLAADVRPALEELEAAIGGRGEYGSNKPYGPPIMQAVESGDLGHMKAVAGAARGALAGVSYHPVTDDEHAAEVRKALAQLEAEIAKLEG